MSRRHQEITKRSRDHLTIVRRDPETDRLALEHRLLRLASWLIVTAIVAGMWGIVVAAAVLEWGI
jgi:hypothetical protein